MTTRSIGILLALLASLAGCAQPARVADSVQIKPGEGVIVYRMNCGPGVEWGQIFRSGASSKGYFAEYKRAGVLSCADGVQTQRLQSGRYFIGKVGYESAIAFSEETAMLFDVAASKLNYIGHISLPSAIERKLGMRRVLIGDPRVIDRRDEALAWLAGNQASMQQQYEFVGALAQSRNSGRTTSLPVAVDPSSVHVRDLTVILKLRVGTDGRVKEGHIAKSSGIASLDAQALRQAIRDWKLTPAIENGAPVEKWGDYSWTLKLTE